MDFPKQGNISPHHFKQLPGPFSFIGDVHGCYGELVELLQSRGYHVDDIITHPEGRTPVFVGDLTDRGPRNLDVSRLVLRSVEQGTALAVPGNHDDKFLRYLNGRRVQMKHGLEETVGEFLALTPDEQREIRRLYEDVLARLPYHLILSNGEVVVTHGGIRTDLIGKTDREARSVCLFGFPEHGKYDEHGLPVRRAWEKTYKGEHTIVYGHTPQRKPYKCGNTYCIDTGCVFGGYLTLLESDSMKVYQVKAKEMYAETKRWGEGGGME